MHGLLRCPVLGCQSTAYTIEYAYTSTCMYNVGMVLNMEDFLGSALSYLQILKVSSIKVSSVLILPGEPLAKGYY